MGVVGVILTTLLYTLLTPKQYRSEMSILVQNARGSYQVTRRKTTNAPMESQITEEQINSEIEVLRSRSLADVVVDPQWKGRPISSMSAQQLKAHDQAVEKFNKHLSVDLVRKSNVIHVAYTASIRGPHLKRSGRLLVPSWQNSRNWTSSRYSKIFHRPRRIAIRRTSMLPSSSCLTISRNSVSFRFPIESRASTAIWLRRKMSCAVPTHRLVKCLSASVSRCIN